MLNAALASVGVSRAECHVSNAALCRGDTDKENELAAACCAPRLTEELAGLDSGAPILALGASATRTILDIRSIMLSRGFVWTAKEIPPERVAGAWRDATRKPKKQPKLSAREAELRDFAAQNVAPEHWHLWQRLAPMFRGSPHERYEAFEQYLHDHPDEALEAAASHADTWLEGETGDRRKEALKLKASTLEGRGKLAGRTVLPLLHPAFVLRADTWNAVWKLDWRRVDRWLKGEFKDESTPEYVVATGEEAERQWQTLGPSVSLDVETTHARGPLDAKLLCVGLSDGLRTVVVYPWREDLAGPLTAFLASRQEVVGHNLMMYDKPVLGAAGVGVRGVNWHDTLLAHHAIVSHYPQRLDFVVSEYCDASPWKVKFGRRAGAEGEKGEAPEDMSAGDLAKYNAADCALTANSWSRLQVDLAPERRVYAHDLRLADVCLHMHKAGIGVDVIRRDELVVLMRAREAELAAEMAQMAGGGFSPSRLEDVRRALFQTLGGGYKTPTAGGLLSTANATLEVMRGADTPAGRFCDLLLEWRGLAKIRATYLEAVYVDDDGRARFQWKPFGTVSGRLACRLQSAPRYNPGDLAARVREIYIPRPGNVFVYFDVSQAEMRLAAYLSSDPVFMAACAGDVHANNAKVLFPEIAAKGWLEPGEKSDPARGKPYRDLAKNMGFAICYGASEEKVWTYLKAHRFGPDGKPLYPEIPYNMCALFLHRLRRSYRVYYKWVEDNLALVRRQGFLRTAILGRIRWLGWYPSPTDVANFPVQSALADVINACTIEVLPRLPVLGASLVAQIHDACIFDCPKERAAELRGVLAAQWAQPISLAGGELILPIDMKEGDRWAGL
jgi:DNA polymerase I-like protein with 3'-5' exonuclease and polymerase domains/uracil-DNA glycosylase